MPIRDELQGIRAEVLKLVGQHAQSGISSSADIIEYSNPSNEEATIARWRPFVEQYGAAILGVTDIPSQPLEFVYDDIIWSVRVMRGDEKQVLPQTGYNRLLALEAAGVPFGWFLWAEERFTRPAFVSIPDAPTKVPAPPAKQRVAPVVQVDPDRAAPKREPEWETWGQMLNRWKHDIAEASKRALDPLLIGVIPTSPNRGVWVVIAKWLH